MINSFSIKFYLYSSVKNGKGESPIYIRIIKDRKKSEASTNEYILPEKWNPDKQRVKETIVSDKQLNHRLTKIEQKIYEYRYRFENESKPYTPKLILDLIKGKRQGDRYTMLGFFDESIKAFEASTTEYGRATILHYKRTRLMLERFLRKESLLNIYLADFGRKNVIDFDQFILTTPNPQTGKCCNRNTTNKYLNKLKRVFGRAYDLELINRNPFDGFVLREPRVNRVYLTDEEINTIANHKLGGNQSLIRVRDFFVFCIFSGLRFSDAAGLKTENIVKGKNGRYYILATQQKTGDNVAIPLLNRAKRIYDKYRKFREETSYILPVISNTKVNLNLKEIARLCNIKKNITTHVARHTFASTVTLDNGIGLKSVSAYLGHRSSKSTEVYLHISKAHLDEVATKLNKVYR